MKSMHGLKNIPVVIMTGSLNKDDRSRANTLGAANFLDQALLEQRIRGHRGLDEGGAGPSSKHRPRELSDPGERVRREADLPAGHQEGAVIAPGPGPVRATCSDAGYLRPFRTFLRTEDLRVRSPMDGPTAQSSWPAFAAASSFVMARLCCNISRVPRRHSCLRLRSTANCLDISTYLSMSPRPSSMNSTLE